jgi:hypothetical protein
MALIAAVIGSFLGVVLGVFSMVFFGASFLAAVALYFTVSIFSVALFALLMLRRAGQSASGADADMVAAYGRYEAEIDADWQAYAAQERSGAGPGKGPRQGPDVPEEAGNRRAGKDRRASGDRRNSA